MFSTITDWPSDVRMRSPRMRASVSLGPPAGNGTIIVTGRDGKVCAWTCATEPTAIARAAAINVVCFMISSPVPSDFACDDDTGSVDPKSQHYCYIDVTAPELAGTPAAAHRCRDNAPRVSGFRRKHLQHAEGRCRR